MEVFFSTCKGRGGLSNKASGHRGYQNGRENEMLKELMLLRTGWALQGHSEDNLGLGTPGILWGLKHSRNVLLVPGWGTPVTGHSRDVVGILQGQGARLGTPAILGYSESGHFKHLSGNRYLVPPPYLGILCGLGTPGILWALQGRTGDSLGLGMQRPLGFPGMPNLFETSPNPSGNLALRGLKRSSLYSRAWLVFSRLPGAP